MKTKIEAAITNIEDDILQETMEYMGNDMGNEKRKKRRSFVGLKSFAAGAAAALAVFFGGMSVAIASGNIEAYGILHDIYPEVAEKLVPVKEASEDQGIKMSVEAIHIEDNKADIYISLQDITGDRLDETVDLFDSYDLHTNSDQIGGCTLVSYDPDKKMATFLISMEQEKKISGNYMKFSVSRLLTGKKGITTELSQVLSADEANHTQKLSEVEVRGSSGEGNLEQPARSTVLANEESQNYSVTEGVTITAYGFIDGELHVQAHYDDIGTYDNHGDIYLENGQDKVYSEYGYSFWDEDGKGSYEEYIFDISKEELSNYKVMGEFVTCNTLIEGDWEIAFPVKEKTSTSK